MFRPTTPATFEQWAGIGSGEGGAASAETEAATLPLPDLRAAVVVRWDL